MTKACILLLFCSTVLPVASQDYSRVEIGPVFSTIFLNQSFDLYQPQLGGRLTLNFNKFLALDSELSSSLRSQSGASSFDGGFALQLFSGIKATARRKNFAVFLKARPGLLSFSGAVKTIIPMPFPMPPDVVLHRVGLFNMDLGGGVEFSAGRHLLFRYDFGDTIIYRPALHGPFPFPSSTVNNFQFETAVGFRF